LQIYKSQLCASKLTVCPITESQKPPRYRTTGVRGASKATAGSAQTLMCSFTG
jgi:hypothetical protein